MLTVSQIHSEILPDAHPASGHLAPDPDGAQQRTDDAVDEGGNHSSGQHEPTDESPCASTDSHGI